MIYPNDFAILETSFKNCIAGNDEFIQVEFRIKNKNGYKWVLNKSKVVKKRDDGSAVRITGTITDVDDQKKYEQKINYLTFYDVLTGLYNRKSFEVKLQEINSIKNFPISIVMVDLNGLKIINDIFGHYEGDRILKNVGKILLESCGPADFVVRWDGDEFVIVLCSVDELKCSAVCKEILKKCDNYSDSPVKISIAVGACTLNNRNDDIQDVFKEAEIRMYRNKLIVSKSSKNNIISSLLKTLSEKNLETEEHTLRIKDVCYKIGEKMKLSDDLLDQLVLLATLHDIGKIGIPDNILNKEGPLSDEEWDIMKTHSDIGFRIANSTPELKHIANAVLRHHERYDGSGYPGGLKAEEIPILSRILSVADSYDAMTHKRPYSNPKTGQEAIKEILRCSGSQFDPNVVKAFISVIKDKKIQTHYTSRDH